MSSAFAHDVPQSTVQLDIGLRNVDAELMLPFSELDTALRLPLIKSPEAAFTTHAELLRSYVLSHVHVTTQDGVLFPVEVKSIEAARSENPNYLSNDWLRVTLRFKSPDGASTERFLLDYDIIVNELVTHSIVVSVRYDLRTGLTDQDTSKLLDVLGFQHTKILVDRSDGAWWNGFGRMFAHGASHIAEGTDHLLFVLVLLLPAPLMAIAGRWRKHRSLRDSLWMIVKTVSGFTVGHSITLFLGCAGLIVLPSQPIEVLIALSIAISAIHAWRPLFAGREVLLSSAFGLVHGLAFASTLTGLDFDAWTLGVSVLGFNLGIECMQLAVIASVMPWLLLLSRTSAYGAIRLTGAAVATLAALAWIVERVSDQSNIVARSVEELSQHPAMLIASLAAITLVATTIDRLRSFKTLDPEPRDLPAAD